MFHRGPLAEYVGLHGQRYLDFVRPLKHTPAVAGPASRSKGRPTPLFPAFAGHGPGKHPRVPSRRGELVLPTELSSFLSLQPPRRPMLNVGPSALQRTLAVNRLNTTTATGVPSGDRKLRQLRHSRGVSGVARAIGGFVGRQAHELLDPATSSIAALGPGLDRSSKVSAWRRFGLLVDAAGATTGALAGGVGGGGAADAAAIRPAPAMNALKARATPWYRGDAFGWQHAQLNPRQLDENAALGPGLYLTDSPHVASDYTEKGIQGERQGVQLVSASSQKELAKKIAFHVQQLRKEGLEITDIRQAGETHIRNTNVFGKPIPALSNERLARIEFTDPRLAPHVKAYQLNPGYIHHELDRLPPRFAAPLARAYRHELEGRALQAASDHPLLRVRYVSVAQRNFENYLRGLGTEPVMPRGRELVGELAYYLRSGRAASRVLRRSGIDAMLYPGGQRTGSGRAHNALAVYNPRIASPAVGFKPSGAAADRARAVLNRYGDMLAQGKINAAQAGRQAGADVAGEYRPQDLDNLAIGTAMELGVPKALEKAFRRAFLNAYFEHQRSPFNPR